MAEQNMTPDLELNVPAAPSLTLEADAPTLTLDPAADEKVVEEAKKAAPRQGRGHPALARRAADGRRFCREDRHHQLADGAAVRRGQPEKAQAIFPTPRSHRVKTKDMGETGELITDLIGELQGFDATEETKGIFGFFKRQQANLENLKTKYEKATSTSSASRPSSRTTRSR